ncbi:MAG: hypothetical protein K2I10_05360 [Lachnospiraceae bacterium]|nr:hypothetical protein [Lachnospiraceae bacterium]
MEKMELFADKVRIQNHDSGLGRKSVLVLFFANLIWHCMQWDYQKILMEVPLRLLFFMLCESFLLAYYVAWYMNQYTKMDNRRGKPAEGIADSIFWMPFSVETYYSCIGLRLKRHMRVIGIALLMILLSGMFVHFEINEFIDNWLLELDWVIPKTTARWSLSMLFIGVGLGMFFATAVGVYRIHRYITTQNILEKRGEITLKARERKRLRGDKKRKNKYSKYDFRLVLQIGVMLSLFMVCGILRNAFFSLQADREMVYSEINQFYFIFTITICAEMMVDQLYRFWKGEKLKKLQFLLVASVSLFVVFFHASTYQCICDDYIETSVLLQKRRYRWEDVTGFSVDAAFLFSDLMLELEMKDGRKVKIREGSITASERHWESYDDEYGHYRYVADIVSRLGKMGIEGVLEREDKLERKGDAASLQTIKTYTR